MKGLFGFQQEALQFALSKDRTALYLKMGLGKTLIALYWLSEVAKDNDRLLIITFPAILESWKKELKQFQNFIINDFSKSKKILFEKNVVNLITIDTFKNIEIDDKDLVIIIDESQSIKGKSSSRSKTLLKLSPYIKKLLLLSGTPATNGNQDLYTQLKILGIWNKSYKEFEDRFLITRQMQGANYRFNLIIGNKNQEELNKLMQPNCYFLSNEKIAEFQELIKKTEPVDEVVEVIWNDDELKSLRQKIRDKVFETSSSNYIICDNLMKLMHTNLEFVSGAFKIKGGFEIQHLRKAIKFKYFIIEKKINKAIIFYNYDSELFLIKSILNNLQHTFTTKKDDLLSEIDFLLLQYKSGSTGIDGLQKHFNTTIYFSPTYSCEQHLQSKARTNRLGQEKKCYYYHFVTKGTLEQKVYETLVSKKNFTKKMFEDNIRELKGGD